MGERMEEVRLCVSRDGTRIAYGHGGSGPPLLWVQYWGHHLDLDWSSPVWKPWLLALMSRYTLIRFDWRGCGLSDREGIDFSFDRYVEDIEAVVAAAGIDQFALLGMAAGAGTAMTYAVRHPARVQHLLVYAAQVRGRLARCATKEQVEETETRLQMVRLGWQTKSRAFGQFLTSLHIPDGTPQQLDAFAELMRATTSSANAVSLLKSFYAYDLAEVVPLVLVPTLVLQPSDSSIIPLEEGRIVASLIPDARLVQLETRNLIMLEGEPAWQKMIDAIDDFIPTYKAFSRGSIIDELTSREREVLTLVSEGLRNEAIAERLRISEKTVRNHFSRVLGKLQISSRAEAVAFARDIGLGHSRSTWT